MKKHLFLSSVFVVILSVLTFGQQTETQRNNQQRQEKLAQERQIEAQRGRIQSESNEKQRSFEKWNRETMVRDFFYRHSDKGLSKGEIAKIEADLKPNPEDTTKYKDFLRQQNTGLFRLLPNLGCHQKYTIRADEDCLSSAFGGDFYSFRLKVYSDENLYDITLKDGNLISRGYLSQAILTTLGDVPLDDVLRSSSGVKFLLDFKPEVDSSKVKRQFNEITAAVDSDGYHYAKSAKAILNTTYALRIIAYLPDDKVKAEDSVEYKKYSSVKFDERNDLTLAFRIVRKDENGSLTILWKELSRSKAPKINFAK